LPKVTTWSLTAAHIAEDNPIRRPPSVSSNPYEIINVDNPTGSGLSVWLKEGGSAMVTVIQTVGFEETVCTVIYIQK